MTAPSSSPPPSAPPARRRRRLLGGGVAAAAALAGLGGAWWFEQGGSGGAPRVSDTLWDLRFPRPDGQELAFADLRGRPLLINFWATWCAPCVKEMPELDRFAQAHASQGIAVVGLALDTAEPVRAFLQRIPVSFNIGLAGLAGSELGRQLGNDRGALPFTVLLDAQGRLRERKLGQTHYDELASWAQRL